jgi:hypothetical protein
LSCDEGGDVSWEKEMWLAYVPMWWLDLDNLIWDFKVAAEPKPC